MKSHTEQPQKSKFENSHDDAEVIIIDDDQGFSFMLKDYLLTNANMKSELFSNGNDFLKIYKPGDNQKIILDYEFKEGPDGISILGKIKAMNPLAIVIIVSAQDDLEKAVETLRSGATDYFLKANKTVFTNIVCSLMKLKEMEKNKLN